MLFTMCFFCCLMPYVSFETGSACAICHDTIICHYTYTPRVLHISAFIFTLLQCIVGSLRGLYAWTDGYNLIAKLEITVWPGNYVQSMKHLSSKTYETLHESGCNTLQSQRTLRDYTHFVNSTSGLSKEIDSQLICATKLDWHRSLKSVCY